MTRPSYPPITELIKISSNRPLNAIPARILKHFTPAERAAYADHSAAFAKLAKKCLFPPLRKLLEQCADSEGFELEMVRRDSRLYRNYFYFALPEGGTPGIRLAAGSPKSAKCPRMLKEIYSVIGGLCHAGAEYAGGLFCAEDICPLAATGIWVSEDNTIDPAQSFLFLDTLSGNFLCYHPNGKGSWYNHELGRLEPVKSLADELERYFTALLQGEQL